MARGPRAERSEGVNEEHLGLRISGHVKNRPQALGFT
jgi:hypothetical protein